MDRNDNDRYYFIYERPGKVSFCNSDGRIVGLILLFLAFWAIISPLIG